MKIKPVSKVHKKGKYPPQTTTEEHVEAHKNVGKLVKWTEYWPSVDPVATNEWTGVIVEYVETYQGTYHIYRSDGELEPVGMQRVTFFRA